MALPDNPWAHTPTSAPFVLDSDAMAIEVFNRNAAARFRIYDNLVPEPFFGRFSAPVVVLLLNPGVADGDARAHADRRIRKQLLDNLLRDSEDVPHVHLIADRSYPGADWWSRAVAQLKNKRTVARSLLTVQYFPYHSKAFAHSTIRLPSQEFGFSLVRSAMSRGALIVQARGRDCWFGAVPELADYSRRFDLKNVRSFTLSRGNIERDGFDRVRMAICVLDA